MMASSPTLGRPADGDTPKSSGAVAAAETVLSELDARWRDSAQRTGFVIVGFLRGLIHHFRRQWCVVAAVAGCVALVRQLRPCSFGMCRTRVLVHLTPAGRLH